MVERIEVEGGQLALAALIVCLALSGSPASAEETGSRVLIRTDGQVFDPIVWAMDVRWTSDDSVLVAAGKAGVFEVSVNDPDATPRSVVPGSEGPGGFWLSSRLGRSSTHLVVGAPVFSYSWSPRQKIKLTKIVFDALVDLDVAEDQLLVLGALKDDQDRFSPDGAMAWLGPVAGGRAALKPVLFSIHGPGSKGMVECGIIELGAARFMTDGSFVVVPGVEPGVFWFDASGELKRTWESRDVGLEDECSPVIGHTHELAADPEARNRWINQRIILDEILPMPGGPGLVLRQTRQGVTRWELVQLSPDGGVAVQELPITSTSGWAHLRGDVRGRRIVFLVVEYGLHQPAEPPRLILAELAP